MNYVYPFSNNCKGVYGIFIPGDTSILYHRVGKQIIFFLLFHIDFYAQTKKCMLFILQASMISSRSLPELFKRFCTPTSFISTSPRFVIRYFANPLFLIVFSYYSYLFCFYCTLFVLFSITHFPIPIFSRLYRARPK